MLKIGILSDTHGVVHPGIVELIKNCDIAIHAGDIVDIDVIHKLNPKQKVIAVQGNNDAHISCFEEVETLELPGGKLVVEHGHKHGHHKPSHDSLRSTYPDAKIIVYGHTHKQVIDTDHTPWVINPGAAGDIRNYGSAKCLTININSPDDWDLKSHKFY
mgnify:CR=1 FL=1|jgi:hypothetical protein